jgi:hypothetical protein
MEYIPDGLSKEQWAKIKGKDKSTKKVWTLQWMQSQVPLDFTPFFWFENSPADLMGSRGLNSGLVRWLTTRKAARLESCNQTW